MHSPLRALVPLIAVLAAAWAALPTPKPPVRSLPGREVYQRTLTGVAWVMAADRGKGTGWVVDRTRRWLVTCYHVVGEQPTAWVVFPDRDGGAVVGPRQHYLAQMPALRRRGLAVQARVLRKNPQTDLALLELERLPPGVTALPLASAPARPGDRVHLVGNRYDVDVLWTHATGTVRAARTLRDGYFNSGQQLARGARVLLAGVPINEGDSGGPLIKDGCVVGVAAAVAWEIQGAGLFIDLAELRKFLEQPASTSEPPALSGAAAVYRQVVSSVAVVEYEGGPRRAGVLLDRAKRLVLTTAEAVAKEATVEVTFPVEQSGEMVTLARWYRDEKDLLRRKGHTSTGVVLAVDPRRNLALVEVARLPSDAKEAVLAEATPRPGEELQLISHPRRLEVLWVHAQTSLRQTGHINLGQTSDGPDPAVLLLQAAVGEGESGGPVVNGDARLVGLLTGRSAAQQQVSYALAAVELRVFCELHRPFRQPRTASDHCQRSEVFVRAHQYDRAEKEYNAALKRDDRHVPAYIGRSGVRSQMGQWDLALADAGRALELEPRSVLALCRRAAALSGKGDAKSALRDLDQAVKLNARSALAFALRGQVRLQLGQLEQARADCDEAVWLDSRLALAYRLRGLVHARLEASAKALADLSQAIALDPNDPLGYRQRAELHAQLNDVEAALADFNQCLKRTPTDAQARHGRSRVWISKGAYDSALADLDAAIRLQPNLAVAYLDRGREYLRRGRHGRAVAELLRAVRLDATLAPQALREIVRAGRAARRLD